MNGLGGRPLSVIVVGTGFVAPYHVAGWRACAGVTVAGAVVRDVERARQRAQTLGIDRLFTSIDEAVAATGADIVDIASPLDCHVAHVEEAVAAGCHLMVQKPLAPTLAQAQHLARLVASANVRAMVHENFRFRPWNRALKRLLAAGDIGTPFYLRSSQRMAGTVRTAAHPERPWSLERQPFFAGIKRFLILESVIHQIDVARYLLGEPTRLFARARRVSPEVRGEDTAMIMLAFADADAVIERSYASLGYAPPGSGAGESVALEGDEGTAFIAPDGTVRLVRDGPAGRSERAVPVDLSDAYPRSYGAAIAHFVAALREGRPFETDLSDNLATLAATFAAYRSVETGEAVALAPRQMEAAS